MAGQGPSTPAHAGPTSWGVARPSRHALYPRARGADQMSSRSPSDDAPLPPRTRGRRAPKAVAAAHAASTPAHAGPTRDRPPRPGRDRLYPRARGADAARRPPASCWSASTPAHAGPTSPTAPRPRPACLYPRARGADADFASPACRCAPLPPRTRGRLPDPVDGRPDAASTPAHAGPTPHSPPSSSHPSLYPRARGADKPVFSSVRLLIPLPPRTRGRPLEYR